MIEELSSESYERRFEIPEGEEGVFIRRALMSSPTIREKFILNEESKLTYVLIAISPSIKANVEVVHRRKSVSRVLIKAISPSAELEGIIRLGKESDESDAQLSLYAYPKGRLSPNLEIKNGNLSASHSAGIFYPSEEDVFYLQTRGISKSRAMFLLLKGFIYHPLAYDERVEEALEEAIKGGLLTLSL